MFRSLFNSGKQEKERKKEKEVTPLNVGGGTASKVFESCNGQIVSTVISASKFYYLTLNDFLTGNRKALKELYDDVCGLNEQTKKQKNGSFQVIAGLHGDALESSLYYVRVVDAACEMAGSIYQTYQSTYEYLKNNHPPFSEVQATELTELNDEISLFFNTILHILKNCKYDNSSEEIRKRKTTVLALIDILQRKQLKRIKRKEVSTRNSILYLNILTETKNLILFAANLMKANRNFYQTMHPSER